MERSILYHDLIVLGKNEPQIPSKEKIFHDSADFIFLRLNTKHKACISDDIEDTKFSFPETIRCFFIKHLENVVLFSQSLRFSMTFTFLEIDREKKKPKLDRKLLSVLFHRLYIPRCAGSYE